MAAQEEAREAITRIRAEAQDIAKANKERTLWSYVKGSKQSLFNMALAGLALLMAGNMVNRRTQREKLEDQLLEMMRRQSILLRALADEEWAEGAAKRMGAAGGKEALLRELRSVVDECMKDKETLERETLEAAVEDSRRDADKPESSRGLV